MKRLIYRLSSMGDLILSQSALQAPYEGATDWVMLKEFEVLVKDHPRISRLWTFDRKTEGLLGWLKLNLSLIREDYDEVLDLHSSLRTKLAHALFFFVCLYRGVKTPRWRSIGKRRWRRLGYMTFKSLWPRSFRPIPLREASAKLAGGTGEERANLKHLVGSEPEFLRVNPVSEAFYVVMPASAWPGKEWPTNHYLSFVETQKERRVVVAGTSKDEASLRLVAKLKAKGIPHIDAIGKLDLKQTAWLLAHAKFLIANDTGLSHLAEAVGTPVITLYGPTRHDFGFGVSDPRSRALAAPIWCSPCSKDGTLCYRPIERFKCLKMIEPAQAQVAAREIAP